MAVTELADSDPEPAAASAGLSSTRETASDGYRRALAAHQEAAPPARVDPHIAQAVQRQTVAMRELSRRAFPETDDLAGDAAALSQQIGRQRRRQAAAIEAAALRRAHAERTHGVSELRRPG